MGRPSSYTPQIGNLICERLAEGESLSAICRDEAMPAKGTVCRWLGQFPEFQDEYARARELQAEGIFDELFDIVDDGSNDWMERETRNGTITVVDHEHVTRSRLRFDARRWALARMAPKKYGERIQQELTNPDGSLRAPSMSDAQLAAALNALAASTAKTVDIGVIPDSPDDPETLLIDVGEDGFTQNGGFTSETPDYEGLPGADLV